MNLILTQLLSVCLSLYFVYFVFDKRTESTTYKLHIISLFALVCWIIYYASNLVWIIYYASNLVWKAYKI